MEKRIEDISVNRKLEKQTAWTEGVRRWVFVIVLCMFVGVSLTGCRNNPTVSVMWNVEERDYATILLVSEGEEKLYQISLGVAKERRRGEDAQIETVSEWECDDFKELRKQYLQIKGKELSLSHLKVILLSFEDFDITQFKLQKLFFMFDEEKEIAKTCPVLTLSEKEKFLNYLKEAKSPVGTYMDSIIKAAEMEGNEIPWLKDYLKALREEMQVQEYQLKPVEEGWRIGTIFSSLNILIKSGNTFM